MKTMQVREAKAGFSALAAAAENGEATIITKHGKPAAAVVPIDDARRLYPERKRDFIDFLLKYPGGVELERDQSRHFAALGVAHLDPLADALPDT